MRFLFAIALVLSVGCASHLKWLGSPNDAVVVRVESSVEHPVVGSGLFASGQNLDDVVFDGAVQALSTKGFRVSPDAKRVLTIRLTSLDDSLLQSARAVRMGFDLRFETPAGAQTWSWGPKNIRMQLPAANRSLAPYIREGIARALDDGPQVPASQSQKGLPN